jgi:hypothetical protein
VLDELRGHAAVGEDREGPNGDERADDEQPENTPSDPGPE